MTVFLNDCSSADYSWFLKRYTSQTISCRLASLPAVAPLFLCWVRPRLHTLRLAARSTHLAARLVVVAVVLVVVLFSCFC